MRQSHALIAGAGIGGLTAALCLARQGWRISLFEQAPVLEEVGAGLQLSPNASAILRGLGVLPHLEHAALRPQELVLRRARDGASLIRLPLHEAEHLWGAPYLLAHRADLQRALLETLALHENISLRLGSTVAGFASGADGVRIVVKHGQIKSTFEGDCLIGADGVHSLVRGRLLEASQPLPQTKRELCKRTAWRALVPAELASTEMLKPRTNLWLGPDAHLVHYPLRQGTVVNVVAVIKTRPSTDSTQTFWAGIGDPAELAQSFTTWAEPARALLAAAPQWRTHPLLDYPPFPTWCAGRVALLGDAAHPMVPFLAQGAAQAIEDAAMLGHVLAEPLTGTQTIETALVTYQKQRYARASKVQAASRRQATIYHLKGPAALARDTVLRFSNPERTLAGYGWLYQVQNYPQDELT
ncbi:FAD-dependent monooxygenase [Beijerinckia indica]|uniref:Monooxygenase FAD-binding n=1 Tax=Beijerinckia indica subsp. indica (strain ATCC 9039 / DSM 1715 / NCIMB 8712) TaxID=395963 RepID=B2IHQ1_BEII9|nr:FAD-dependent monooxygenase [Beijerinckia indica]ACB94572.1 monooxygenase FAD-binding [Beijerinckia indica subsp. indica ATCC 9039]